MASEKSKPSLTALLTEYESLHRNREKLERRKGEILAELARELGIPASMVLEVFKGPKEAAALLKWGSPPTKGEIERELREKYREPIQEELKKHSLKEFLLPILTAVFARRVGKAIRKGELPPGGALLGAELLRDLRRTLPRDLMVSSALFAALALGAIRKEEVRKALEEILRGYTKGIPDEDREWIRRETLNKLKELEKKTKSAVQDVLKSEAEEIYERRREEWEREVEGRYRELVEKYGDRVKSIREIEKVLKEMESRAGQVEAAVRERLKEEKEAAKGRLREALREKGLEDMYGEKVDREDTVNLRKLLGEEYSRDLQILDVNPDKLLETMEKLGKREGEKGI